MRTTGVALYAAGLAASALAAALVVAAGHAFQERVGPASVPILAAGALAVLVCSIFAAFSAGRLRHAATGGGGLLLGRPSPRWTVALLGLAVPAASLLFHRLVEAGWVDQPTNVETGTVYSVLLSFCAMWLLVAITDRYGGI